MSFDSRIVYNDENKSNNDSIAEYYRLDTHFDSFVPCTSLLVAHTQQLQTDLHTQHQNEKHALTVLNERFRLFVDHVQQLETQNAKYITQVANFRQQSLDISSVDAEWHESYLRLQSDHTTVNYGKVDFELGFEMFQLQIAIYQQLLAFEQQEKDERLLKLEHELSQSSSLLNTLRTSYAELGQEEASLSEVRADRFQQFLRLTHNWCHLKKQTKEWKLSIQVLNNQIVFYKNLRSYSARRFESSTVESFDVKQFWALELDKVVKEIRHDFEQLYVTIRREMTAYYETKMEEVETEVQASLHYQQIEREELEMRQHTLYIEYEKVQKSYSYEKEVLTVLEATCYKLELESQSIQRQHDQRFEAQSKDLQSLQGYIMTVAYDIEEMRRRKINLESEIIVYRRLLNISEVHEQVVIVSAPEPVVNARKREFVVKSYVKGSIAIQKCPPDGTYISLMNHLTNKDIDISRWVLTRRTDSKKELRYTLPDGIRLQPGGELTIYSELDAGAAKYSSNSSGVSSSLRQKLVNREAVAWGTGDEIETVLFNHQGEKEASYFALLLVRAMDDNRPSLFCCPLDRWSPADSTVDRCRSKNKEKKNSNRPSFRSRTTER